MTQDFKRGDYVTVPGMKDEVEVTGFDNGTNELIVRYVRDNGRDAWRTVSRKGVALYVEDTTEFAADPDDVASDRFHNR
jgi:hypothetical protein